MIAEKRLCTCLAVFLAVLIASSGASAKVIHVDDDANGTNDGSSWTNAHPCLQEALAAADWGDEIRVAQGTYRPDRHIGPGRFPGVVASGDRTATFQLVNGVVVRGGYAGLGEPDPNARDIQVYETILSGDLNGDDGPNFSHYSENSFHVLTGSGTDMTAVLEGVTVGGGNADALKPYHAGGGIYSLSGSPTLRHCTFSANRGDAGGGMANDGPGSAVLMSCTFNGNAAENFGGAIYNLVSSPVLTDCVFIGNSATDGGAMLNWNDCQPTLINCTFRGNSARSDGGAIHCHNSEVDVRRSSIVGNSAQHYGGGIYCDRSGQILNSVIAGNSAMYGGGIYSEIKSDSPSPTISHSTIVGNSASGYGGGGIYCGNSSPTVVNTILWGDTPDEIYLKASSVDVSYCDVQGGWPGVGNIDADPLFVDAEGGDGVIGTDDDDLRLSPGSPCIDAGNNQAIPESVVVDLDGNPRTANGTVDMGAYEAHVTAAAAIRYVDGDATGNNDGSSWADAHVCLQDALAAAGDGDEIRVAEGVYRPDQQAMVRRDRLQIVSSGDWTATFQLIDNVVIKGGYAGFGEADGDVRDVDRYTSVLSGDLNADDGDGFINIWDNSYHVVTAIGTGPTAVLEGFTITGGNADGPVDEDHGGGLLNVDGSPLLANCVFSRNVTTGSGGGMYNSGYPVLVNCVFRDNLADLKGGGIYSVGGGPTLTHCAFKNNTGGGGGGGAMYNEDSTPLLADCDFTGNLTSGSGGGMYNNSSDAVILGCQFSANSALRSGGGMYNRYTSEPYLTNCIFSGNSARNGGAMENLNTSKPTLVNCTFSANVAVQAGGGISTIQDGLALLVNCILWDNVDGSGTGTHTSEIRGKAEVSYSCLSSDAWGGAGNIHANPAFAAPGYWDSNGTPDDPSDDFWVEGDYHLKSQVGRWNSATGNWDIDSTSSPCIDAGDPSIFVGLERFPNGGRINMGAYGGTAEASLSPWHGQPTTGQASDPHPANGAVDVAGSVTLIWTAGLNAVTHDVYFGTNVDTLAAATTASAEYTGSIAIGDETYEPGILESGQVYYWRIDEVGGQGTVTTGEVWSFTTASTSPRRRR